MPGERSVRALPEATYPPSVAKGALAAIMKDCVADMNDGAPLRRPAALPLAVPKRGVGGVRFAPPLSGPPSAP